ncbi:hypothetical protein B1218_35085 [Pseudomonas ogarae]|nr:hypothetical protein B1218_35085 [Pseudomonas ogarae]
MARRAALGLYALVLFASTVWALREVGLDWWPLVPRLAGGPLGVGGVARGVRRGGERLREQGASVGGLEGGRRGGIGGRLKRGRGRWGGWGVSGVPRVEQGVRGRGGAGGGGV